MSTSISGHRPHSPHPPLSVVTRVRTPLNSGPRPDVASSLSAPSQVEAPPALPLDADFSRSWAALGGAAARGRLHALHPVRAGDIGAQTGFALTSLAWLATAAPVGGVRRPLLWIQDRHGRMDAGRPYGLGFSTFGLVADDVVVVAVRDALEALTAAETGLDVGELNGVLIELPPSLPADMLRLGKRLALRAERARTACFLLHGGTGSVTMPIATRWFVASAPSFTSPDGHAPPAVCLTLDKNRFGPTGRWRAGLAAPPPALLQTSSRHDASAPSHTSSPHPVALAAAPGDRQAATAGRLAATA